MGSFQISGTHQKFIGDLSTGKFKGLLEKFYPILPVQRMVMIQPILKRTNKTVLELGGKIATVADNDNAPVSSSKVSQEVEEFIRLVMPVWLALEATTTTAAELIGLRDNRSDCGRVRS